MDLYTIIVLLSGHFTADFLFQNQWMAQNKSKNNFPLTVHCIVYSIVFFLILFLFIKDVDITKLLEFSIISGVLHFVVDYFTSKITSWQYKNGYMGSNKIPNIGFFSTIGLDQLLHYIALFTIYHHMFMEI